MPHTISLYLHCDGDNLCADCFRIVEGEPLGIFAGYKNWLNFNTTMVHIVQEHCEGYDK